MNKEKEAIPALSPDAFEIGNDEQAPTIECFAPADEPLPVLPEHTSVSVVRTELLVGQHLSGDIGHHDAEDIGQIALSGRFLNYMITMDVIEVGNEQDAAIDVGTRRVWLTKNGRVYRTVGALRAVLRRQTANTVREQAPRVRKRHAFEINPTMPGDDMDAQPQLIDALAEPEIPDLSAMLQTIVARSEATPLHRDVCRGIESFVQTPRGPITPALLASSAMAAEFAKHASQRFPEHFATAAKERLFTKLSAEILEHLAGWQAARYDDSWDVIG